MEFNNNIYVDHGRAPQPKEHSGNCGWLNKMTFADQIQYCAILSGTVTIGMTLLHREFKEEK